MIVAKTKMRKIPKSCKTCSLRHDERMSQGQYYSLCCITLRSCPMEKKKSGNYGYIRPTWCPLMEVEESAEKEN